MATNYPSGLDSFTNPAGTDALSTGHAAQHANANDAVEAIEAELGTNPSGSELTVKARFETIEANDWVTTARIGNSQVTSAKIADATITGSDIATGTVTSTNIANDTIVNADVNSAAAIDKTKIAGTAVTVADTGTVTSTMILDGTIVNGDISASAAIDPSKVAQNVVTFSNADAVVATSTRKLAQIGTMSASRTVTLPAASGVAAGTELVVADLSGTVTSTNTIVISRAGSDTVNGATSVTIGAAYGWRRFVSDGSSKWVFDGGVHRTSDTGTVTSTNILDGTIATADLADGAITPIKTSGGYVAKTALYTATNDDRVIDCTSGTYTVTLPTAASQTGRTFIIRNSGTGTITIGRTGAETISGATSQTLAGYGSLDVISNGTNWLVLRGTYTDETVGRRIFTWDTVNSRWQMTFGDTGWRDVSAGLESGTTGEWRMRRVNSTVTHHVYNVTNSSGVMYTIPAGFRTASYGTVIPLTKWDLTAGAVLLNSPAPGNCTLSDGLKGYTGAYYMFTHDTSEAWPTSLPGSAVGSIPA